MALTAPPERLVDFCRLIATTNLPDLLKRRDVVDARNPCPQTDTERRKNGSLLQSSLTAIRQLQNKYDDLQLALYDFRGGYCDMCRIPPEMQHLSERHVHGCQSSGVLEAKEIPGLLVYSGLFKEGVVQKRLMEELLGHPRTESEPVENQQEESAPLPECVSSLFGSVFNLGRGTVFRQESSIDKLLPLQLGSDENEQELHVPLGCDTVLAFGLRDDDLALLPAEAEVPRTDAIDTRLVTEFGWEDLLAGSDEEEQIQPVSKRLKVGGSSAESRATTEYAYKPKPKPQDVCEPSEADKLDESTSTTLQSGYTAPVSTTAHHERGQLGIILRPGDVVAMSGPALRAWRGVAKVIPDTSPAWEQEWPGRDDRVRIPALRAYRGYMKDCSVSFTIA